MELPEALRERLLDTWPVAVLATVADGGRPHLVPVVFARHEGSFWSPVDGKPKAGGELARLRHVEAEPRVALLLERYEADWSRLWWIRIDARAAVLRGRTAPGFEAAASALLGKYPQYAETPPFLEEPTLLRLAPERITSWCAGDGALR